MDRTKRPNAKDALRARAVELRRDGWSVNDIALEVGVAKSTVWQWVRHLPLDPDASRARQKRAHSKLMTDALWSAHRAARDARRAAAWAGAAAEIGEISDRELRLLGAILYWCEGTKAKPWRPNDERLDLINSDPMLIELFLRFMEALGRPRGELRYRVTIHESSDASAAQRWWARRLDLPENRFHRPTLKRHNVKTTRHNTGDDYHGCLVVGVPRGRELYWLVEGIVRGVCGAAGGSGCASGGSSA